MNDPTPVPAQFDPADTALTGLEVLRHGLPPLPAVLARQMSVPVAFWTSASASSRSIRSRPMTSYPDPH